MRFEPGTSCIIRECSTTELSLFESRFAFTAKKYKCDKCDFSCIERYRLKAHIEAIHKKSVRYECEKCKYFSFRKGGLQTHIKMVHEKHRPHQCEGCDLTFIYRRDKLKHMAIKHGVLPEQPH